MALALRLVLVPVARLVLVVLGRQPALVALVALHRLPPH